MAEQKEIGGHVVVVDLGRWPIGLQLFWVIVTIVCPYCVCQLNYGLAGLRHSTCQVMGSTAAGEGWVG